MTEAAQEHLTGMPTPNFALPWTITNTHREHVDITDARGKSVLEQIRADYATLIVKAVNAYGSTDALRSALHVAEQNFEAIRKVLVNNLVEPERSAFWLAVRARDGARAALSGSPAPSTEGLECSKR